MVTLFAEFVANDRPLLVKFQGHFYLPVLSFHSEADFGGEFQTEAEYSAPEVRCLIRTGGVEACLDDPDAIYQEAVTKGTVDGQPIAQPGWILWPPIPYSFNTINYGVATAPSPPDRDHWLGTDDQTRDVLARVIYGFRISVLFALVVAASPASSASSPAPARASSAAGSTSSSSVSSRSGSTCPAST